MSWGAAKVLQLDLLRKFLQTESTLLLDKVKQNGFAYFYWPFLKDLRKVEGMLITTTAHAVQHAVPFYSP